MLREITARHNDEKSGDQCVINRQCVLRVVGGDRSVSCRKKFRTGIIVSTLYDGTESPGYTISKDTKSYYQIWTTQQSIGEYIYHRKTEDLKYSPDMAHWRQEGEARQSVVRPRSARWQCGPFHVNKKSIPARELATEQKGAQKIFLRSVSMQ